MGLKAGQEFWYRVRFVDRIGNQSAWTQIVRGQSTASGGDYLDAIGGDFLSAEDGQALTEKVDFNLEAQMNAALAHNNSVSYQFRENGKARAEILEVKTTQVSDKESLAQYKLTVAAKFGEQQAAIDESFKAVVDATSATAIYTLKCGVNYNGTYYDAGLSIATIANGDGVTSRIGMNADQFVMLTGQGDDAFSPFAVKNGQVFIASAMIEEGTITSAMIGEYIQSTNYVADTSGWRLDKAGTLQINGGTGGNRIKLSASGFDMHLADGGRIVLGEWT